MPDLKIIRRFETLGMRDIALVGGKNAALGELIHGLRRAGIASPAGFAVTVDLYRLLLVENNLEDIIRNKLAALEKGHVSLQAAGRFIRKKIQDARMPTIGVKAIKSAYQALCEETGEGIISVAVRSSATAEDLPEASFAGQLDSYLNITGDAALLKACQDCFASLFTNRAITYRRLHGFDHMEVALSVGVQQMIRSDRGSAGVMFSIDTETGFPDCVVINAAWGLGESVVQGAVNPDEYMIFKPLLSKTSKIPIIKKRLGAKERKTVYRKGNTGGTRTVATSRREQTCFVLDDQDIITLARWAGKTEKHFRRPMDMEWAKDGLTGKLFMLQARPETVHAHLSGKVKKNYRLLEQGKVLVEGQSIGGAIATGVVCVLKNLADAGDVPDDAVLVTRKTDPDWLPIMRRASALITDHGGRTSHAAIVSRELGLPAIVGTGNASGILSTGQTVTVSCAEGDRGFVYDGSLKFKMVEQVPTHSPETKTQIMLNMADPGAALSWWHLPADGIGLARMEFIIAHNIRTHPMALLNFDRIKDRQVRKIINDLVRPYAGRAEYFVEKLAVDIARIAASRYPKRVIVRLSDFKTNEYANLIGGEPFEPEEANPMIGWRGASRYYDDRYRAGFALECQALKRARDIIGLDNIAIMIPFCRTIQEADLVLRELASHGLRRGKRKLKIYIMAEIPANIILAEDFAERFDGFSIGSNDLTQLTLGVDRDSEDLAHLFDAKDPAVISLIRDLIRRAHASGATVGFCGQAPSDDPDYARILVAAGIDSISVTPDSFEAVKNSVSKAEAGLADGL